MAKSLSQHRFGPQFHNSIIPYPNHLHQQHQTPQRHSTSFPGDSKQGTRQSSPALRRKPQNPGEQPAKIPFGKAPVQACGFASLWVLLPGTDPSVPWDEGKTAFGGEAPGADRILASPQMGHGAAKLAKDTGDRARHGAAALAGNYFRGIPRDTECYTESHSLGSGLGSALLMESDATTAPWPWHPGLPHCAVPKAALCAPARVQQQGHLL